MRLREVTHEQKRRYGNSGYGCKSESPRLGSSRYGCWYRSVLLNDAWRVAVDEISSVHIAKDLVVLINEVALWAQFHRVPPGDPNFGLGRGG